MLLTAYADTGAAIDAINVVDLDHYLLKPWDPPEEKLYPVVDDLLEAWKRSDHRPVPSTKVVGHRWSARSSDVREFLARNQVPYRWYSFDEPEDGDCWRRPARTGCGCRWWSPRTGRRWSSRSPPTWPRTWVSPPPRRPTSTTWW